MAKIAIAEIEDSYYVIEGEQMPYGATEVFPRKRGVVKKDVGNLRSEKEVRVFEDEDGNFYSFYLDRGYVETRDLLDQSRSDVEVH